MVLEKNIALTMQSYPKFKIQTAIEDRKYSCGIFLDFSKAFDTVNHKILLKKLEHYGIRGIANDWFNSYLSNRQQTVTANNITSDKCKLNCGIPQRLMLGPLFFLCLRLL